MRVLAYSITCVKRNLLRRVAGIFLDRKLPELPCSDGEYPYDYDVQTQVPPWEASEEEIGRDCGGQSDGEDDIEEDSRPAAVKVPRILADVLEIEPQCLPYL